MISLPLVIAAEAKLFRDLCAIWGVMPSRRSRRDLIDSSPVQVVRGGLPYR